MAETLYRKYRPQTFKDVLGQDHIVTVLEGALKEGNIAHAYLFAGTRGIGKTSVARILAHEIGTSEKDLYEIDAASNRGIDDVRELREAVSALPFDSEYKVYIIDEVHMLTTPAFNALLKTLEEPPAHVVFILATTEMHKLPDTVISRCEVHQFKQPSRTLLKEDVVKLAKKEGYTLEHSAADLVALLAEGSFRDAQGILQKILNASSDKKISVDEVALVTGAPKTALVNRVIVALDEGKLEDGLTALHEAEEGNVDATVFLKLILEKARAVLMLRFASHAKKCLAEAFSEEDMTMLDEVAHNKGSQVNARALEHLLEAYILIGRAYNPYVPLELALMELLGGNTEGTLFGK